jgi:hypothetical protein
LFDNIHMTSTITEFLFIASVAPWTSLSLWASAQDYKVLDSIEVLWDKVVEGFEASRAHLLKLTENKEDLRRPNLLELD